MTSASSAMADINSYFKGENGCIAWLALANIGLPVENDHNWKWSKTIYCHYVMVISLPDL